MAFLQEQGVRAFRRSGGAVWREVSHCARTTSGRRFGKALLAAAIVGVSLKLYQRYKASQRRQRWSQAGKDVVVLHQFERGTNLPNLSPFALKLETFLRMAGIKYVIDTEEPQGRRGKCPWITINGQELTDSELIIDYLTKHFNTPIKEKLSPEQHAIGRAVQVMLDEHTIVAVAYKRYVIDRMSNVMKSFPRQYQNLLWIFWPVFSKQLRKYFFTNGMGRFSEQEALFFLRRELRALNDIIGDKPYLLSSEPSTYDAAVFAELTQVIIACAPEIESFVRDNLPALVRYHERVRDKYWPDWEQCRSE